MGDEPSIEPDEQLLERPEPGGRRRKYLMLGAAGLVAVGIVAAMFGLFRQETLQDLEEVILAFCSQILCVLPFEVAREQGYFEEEGIDIQLEYMEGGALAMAALQDGGVDWVGTTMDVTTRTTDEGGDAVMLTSTAQLPFFALVTAPDRADEITTLADLEGRSIGVGNLGTTDHLMMMYLLAENDIDPDAVEFVNLGPNLLDAVREGDVDSGMVQEPALTYLQEDGGSVLVNFMSVEDAEEYLGGTYQFMGLITRPDVLEDEANQDLAERMIRALVRAQQFIRENPGQVSVSALPEDLLSPAEHEAFGAILDQHKENLYTADGYIDLDAVERVVEVQTRAGLVQHPDRVVPSAMFTNAYNEFVIED